MSARVVEELREARACIDAIERWTTGAVARDSMHEDCDPEAEDAVCFCAVVALIVSGAGHEATEVLQQTANDLGYDGHTDDPAEALNDADDTRHEPALYLAAEDVDEHGRCKLTSISDDVWSCPMLGDVEMVAASAILRAATCGLALDVVLLAAAIEDCDTIEARPSPWPKRYRPIRSAYAMLTDGERHVLATRAAKVST